MTSGRQEEDAAMPCLFALALCAMSPALPAQAKKHDPIVDIAKGKPEMAAAIRKARAGLPGFWQRAAAPGPGESYFLIKFDLVPGEVDEYIWAQVITHAGGVTTARLVNRPRAPGYAKGQEVQVPDAQVIDWSYVEDDARVIGAETTRALLAMVPPAEAAALRRSHGWD
jgi:uncharacterized protein YegJ (DUF2314 family)